MNEFIAGKVSFRTAQAVSVRHSPNA